MEPYYNYNVIITIIKFIYYYSTIRVYHVFGDRKFGLNCVFNIVYDNQNNIIIIHLYRSHLKVL